MIEVMQSARGASAYPAPLRRTSGPLSEAASFGTSPHSVPARGWTDLIDDLLRIRKYEDDWDGEGTEALDPMLVHSALQLAWRLRASGFAPADRVLAGVNRTVSFEWHLARGFQ